MNMSLYASLLSTNHLILSDQSQHSLSLVNILQMLNIKIGSFGTLDPDCLKLAELCSKAVDYPKTGVPVNMAATPRFLIPYKPDWKSDETMNPRWTDYYESTRAIGHLFRAITLEKNVKELSFDSRTSTLADKPKPSGLQPIQVDAITSTLSPLVEEYLRHHPKDWMEAIMPNLLSKYCLQLRYICLTHTLSQDSRAMLREEEIVVGTILAKCSQTRWRKDRIEEMRINTSQLVRLVSAEFRGSDALENLGKAWTAWKYAHAHPHEFGQQSFALIALESVFKAIDELKNIKIDTI